MENTRQNNHNDYVFQEFDYVWSMSAQLASIVFKKLSQLLIKRSRTKQGNVSRSAPNNNLSQFKIFPSKLCGNRGCNGKIRGKF